MWSEVFYSNISFLKVKKKLAHLQIFARRLIIGLWKAWWPPFSQFLCHKNVEHFFIVKNTVFFMINAYYTINEAMFFLEIYSIKLISHYFHISQSFWIILIHFGNFGFFGQKAYLHIVVLAFLRDFGFDRSKQNAKS